MQGPEAKARPLILQANHHGAMNHVCHSGLLRQS